MAQVFVERGADQGFDLHGARIGFGTLRALVLHDLTGPDALRLEEHPAPEAPEGTAAIEVHAAGIGFVDWFEAGLLPVAGLSEHPLDEVPGVLRALGSRRLHGKPVALVR